MKIFQKKLNWDKIDFKLWSEINPKKADFRVKIHVLKGHHLVGLESCIRSKFKRFYYKKTKIYCNHNMYGMKNFWFSQIKIFQLLLIQLFFLRLVYKNILYLRSKEKNSQCIFLSLFLDFGFDAFFRCVIMVFTLRIQIKCSWRSWEPFPNKKFNALKPAALVCWNEKFESFLILNFDVFF